MKTAGVVVALVGCLGMLWAGPTAQAKEDSILLVVCYPGGPVNPKEANDTMGSMLRLVERAGSWKANSMSSLFTTSLDECKKLIQEKKPAYAIVTLGLYLDLRDVNHWSPIIQPKIKGKTVESYRVVALKNKAKSLDELKGKILGGTTLEELHFLQRIVFKGALDPKTAFVLKPTNQPLRALRSLDKGELDAVLLNEQQYNALQQLPLAQKVEAVFTSDPIPLMGVVVDEKSVTKEETGRFVKALSGICQEAEGKKMCELFGVEAFTPVGATVFDSVSQLWKTAGK